MPDQFRDPAASAHADSIIDVLAAQCADLESLLDLARLERRLAEAGEFDDLLETVAERARLGDRLETYQRQIAELRRRLGDIPAGDPVAARSVELANQIRLEDSGTLLLLTEGRAELSRACRRADDARRNVNAYLRDARTTPVAYDARG